MFGEVQGEWLPVPAAVLGAPFETRCGGQNDDAQGRARLARVARHGQDQRARQPVDLVLLGPRAWARAIGRGDRATSVRGG